MTMIKKNNVIKYYCTIQTEQSGRKEVLFMEKLFPHFYMWIYFIFTVIIKSHQNEIFPFFVSVLMNVNFIKKEIFVLFNKVDLSGIEKFALKKKIKRSGLVLGVNIISF